MYWECTLLDDATGAKQKANRMQTLLQTDACYPTWIRNILIVHHDVRSAGVPEKGDRAPFGHQDKKAKYLALAQLPSPVPTRNKHIHDKGLILSKMRSGSLSHRSEQLQKHRCM